MAKLKMKKKTEYEFEIDQFTILVSDKSGEQKWIISFTDEGQGFFALNKNQMKELVQAYNEVNGKPSKEIIVGAPIVESVGQVIVRPAPAPEIELPRQIPPAFKAVDNEAAQYMANI